METINFTSPYNNSVSFPLSWREGSFKPTATSDFLIKAICQESNSPVRTLLDLGCGIGVVGLALMKHKVTEKLYASDLSPESVALTEYNCQQNNVDVDARVSDIFENWAGLKMDVIANDISGIAEDVAKASVWFDNVPSNSGADGTDNVIKVIEQAKSFLNPNGVLYFPAISLSNCSKIIDAAKSQFNNVKKISSNPWFLPDEMTKDIDFLEIQAYKGNISYEVKFGKVICYTDIYSAQ